MNNFLVKTSAVFLSVFLSLALWVTGAYAQDFVVNSEYDPAEPTAVLNCNADAEPTDVCTLREAILQANNLAPRPSTISFADSVDSIVLHDVVYEISTVININGPIVIDGNTQFQIFHVNELAVLTLNQVTLQNGYFNYQEYLMSALSDGSVAGDNLFMGGGAVFNQGTVNAFNSVFQNNISDSFGGAINNEGMVRAEHSIFTNNTGRIAGGAIATMASDANKFVFLQNVVMHQNSGSLGGAIALLPSYTYAISMNGYEGAIVPNKVEIDNSSFYDNSADISGGAVYSMNGEVNLLNSTLANNTAPNGGAVTSSPSSEDLFNLLYQRVEQIDYVSDNSHLPPPVLQALQELEDQVKATLNTNLALLQESLSDMYSMVNGKYITVTANTALNNGGGFYVLADADQQDHANVSLLASIVMDNIDLADSYTYTYPDETEPTQLDFAYTPNCRGTVNSDGYNVFGQLQECDFQNLENDQIDVNNAQFNEALTILEGGVVYPLKKESIAINVVPGLEKTITTDQLGNSRLGAADAGAWEYQDTVAPVITLNGDDQIKLAVGEVYAEPGATALDDIDGEVPVIIAGDTVDVAKAGNYLLTYTAEDLSGNQVAVYRTVEVLADTVVVPVVVPVDNTNTTVENNNTNTNDNQQNNNTNPADEVVADDTTDNQNNTKEEDNNIDTNNDQPVTDQNNSIIYTNIIAIKSAKKNQVKLIFSNGEQKFYKVFSGKTKKKTAVVKLNDQGLYVVSEAFGRKMALLKISKDNNVKKLKVKKISSKRQRGKNFLKIVTHQKKKYALLVAQKKGQQNSFVLVKLLPTKEKFGKKKQLFSQKKQLKISTFFQK
ncbi:MAG: hypothetical protein A2233_00225 [Candidatus Kerfeldbacteria bacterium RIFOXYA2_FULL_38_24]|uniref:Pesticidal crystal protein Cry22Aa Ig-like domain-containing protein n=1 Tax=Candidatus Kerfeldbacteria bacterium RIFOXYB2_FULL_38_14 TaxID=1798547 RepID=A0A1G2BA43_9BACT|nr:MAG: hypothetical protein A2233_00225 [Candidatus Kerfeldbacteria bacterium RIFOXYA2_FULL_38_24]OGY86021.1 MAG: hypothetical protein A2319_00430 [Candidatus Kerfeldbacteria bacterium RIFOXYB2_FULL_38_14]